MAVSLIKLNKKKDNLLKNFYKNKIAELSCVFFEEINYINIFDILILSYIKFNKNFIFNF